MYSLRRFFWVATTYVLVEKQEKIMFNSVVLSRDTQVNAKYHLIGSNEKDKWPRGYKTFSCSTQLTMKFIMPINVKMPTTVCILTSSMINTTSESLKARKVLIL